MRSISSSAADRLRCGGGPLRLTQGRARRPARRAPTAIFTLALAVAALAGCRGKMRPPPPPPPAVTVMHPAVREVIEWDEYTGRLEAVDFVELRARVSGMIESMPFQEGAIVQQGDVLVRIDVRPFQAELEARMADEARTAAQVDLAQVEYRRISNLAPEARSPTELDAAAAALRQAEAERAAAAAAVAAARLNVEWCEVIAPIRGRIGRKLVTSGNLVSGGTGQGTLLTTITSVDPIYCYVDADERSVLKYAKMARHGTRVSARQAQIPCYMQLTDEEGFPHGGIIDFVDNRVDPATGTIRGRGVFPNPDGWLLPGFFARVRVPGSGTYQAVLIPDSAVVTSQDEKQLLVIDAQDVVSIRPVQLGTLFGEYRAIESGVTPDDRVIVKGLLRARPGMKVNPRESAAQIEKPFLPPMPEVSMTQPARNTATMPTSVPFPPPTADEDAPAKQPPAQEGRP